jgi:CheY-like chemotaxis protein
MSGTDTKGRKPTIVLVVEDEMFVRCNLAECLREADCIVLEAANAEHAMAFCHDGKPVHILITDIHLNDTVTGWDVAEAFRASRNDIPVIYTSENAPDRTRSVPNSMFFNKPYRPAEILRACRQLVGAGRLDADWA